MGPWVHPKLDPGGNLKVLELECGREILQLDLERESGENLLLKSEFKR